jgi:hypothetical protein
VGFGIDLRARSRKGKGLFRRAPDARDVAERLGWLSRRLFKGGRIGKNFSQLALLPGAPALTITVEPEAELTIRGETASLGPGYHADALARLAPLLDELDFVWTTPPPSLADLQAQTTAWLVDALRAGPVRWGVDRPFVIDAPVLTPLGPRDAAWRDAVLAGQSPADAFPWWDAGPGRAALARALVALWHEVPWREPLDDREKDIMRTVDEDLRAARIAGLAVPTGPWGELLVHLGKPDPDLPPGDPIGYRRHDLDVELTGGWHASLPASFIGGWDNDGARYWATDGDRVVELTSLTANDETDSDRLLAVAPEKHPVIGTRRDGTLRGRAEAFDDGDVRIVVGLVADAPHVGILTVKGADDDFALRVWRTLHRP